MIETAVVAMNLGGPDSLEAVEPFLYNIFSDPDVLQFPLGFLYQKALARRIARTRAPESRGFYAKIGGRSPIVELTQKQLALLESKLGPAFKCYMAMRAWKPTTEQAVGELAKDGAKRIVALPLYPQRSRTTTVSSIKELRRVLKARRLDLPVHEVCCYPTHPKFVEAWVERIRATLDGIEPGRRAKAHVLFSAHSLPKSVIEKGDPYLAHVQATVRAVMEKLPGVPHSLAFQSRATKIPWLEPFTQDELTRLAQAGVKDVAVVPIAFLTDHIETLYELDMLIKDHALKVGIEGYHRVAALNSSDKLADALADVVRRALGEGGPLKCGLEKPRCPLAQ